MLYKPTLKLAHFYVNFLTLAKDFSMCVWGRKQLNIINMNKKRVLMDSVVIHTLMLEDLPFSDKIGSYPKFKLLGWIKSTLPLLFITTLEFTSYRDIMLP